MELRSYPPFHGQAKSGSRSTVYRSTSLPGPIESEEDSARVQMSFKSVRQCRNRRREKSGSKRLFHMVGAANANERRAEEESIRGDLQNIFIGLLSRYNSINL